MKGHIQRISFQQFMLSLFHRPRRVLPSSPTPTSPNTSTSLDLSPHSDLQVCPSGFWKRTLRPTTRTNSSGNNNAASTEPACVRVSTDGFGCHEFRQAKPYGSASARSSSLVPVVPACSLAPILRTECGDSWTRLDRRLPTCGAQDS